MRRTDRRVSADDSRLNSVFFLLLYVLLVFLVRSGCTLPRPGLVYSTLSSRVDALIVRLDVIRPLSLLFMRPGLLVLVGFHHLNLVVQRLDLVALRSVVAITCRYVTRQ